MNRRSLILTALLTISMICGAAPVVSASPTTYYVALTGSDTNPGTSALPFRNIQKCADVMVAGDTCEIGTGTYRETVVPAGSGSAGSPITYRPAPGADVRIDGTEPITGSWTKLLPADVSSLALTDPYLLSSPFAVAVGAGKVYKTTVTINTALAAPQVFDGSEMMREAQWPDPTDDPLEPEPKVAAVSVSQTGAQDPAPVIVDPTLTQPAGYWTNARAYVQQAWKTNTATVVGSTPGSITIAGNVGVFPDHWDLCLAPAKARYYLYGKLSELNAQREFFYDAATHTLYLIEPTGAVPSGIAVKQRTLAFDLEDVSHTQLTGLGVYGSTIQTGNSSTGIVLDSMDVRYASHFIDLVPDPYQVAHSSCDSTSAYGATSGIIVRGRGNEVRDSTIQFSAGNGVALLGDGDPGTSDNNVVTNTIIRNVNYGGAHTAGVTLVGTDNSITHNTIEHVGRAGIEGGLVFSDKAGKLTGNTIAYNDISDYGLLSQDFGAIYFVGKDVDLSGGSIDHNWLHDPGAMKDVPAGTTLGVYLDGGTKGALVHSNVGWGNLFGTVGIVSNDVAADTKVFNNDGGVWLYKATSLPGTEIRNNLGGVRFEATSLAPPPAAVSNNEPPSVNLLYNPPFVNEAARDFRLVPGSTECTGGVAIAGVTGTGTSQGAYQCGAAQWIPGATASTPVHPVYAATSVTSATGDWTVAASHPEWALGRLDRRLSIGPRFQDTQVYGRLASFTTNATGDVTYGFTPPSGSGLTLDRATVRLYGLMNRALPTTAENVTLTIPGMGTVFDAGGVPFHRVGKPIEIDITTAVGGDWTKLPTSMTIHAEEAIDVPLVSGPHASGILIFAVEVHIDAH